MPVYRTLAVAVTLVVAALWVALSSSQAMAADPALGFDHRTGTDLGPAEINTGPKIVAPGANVHIPLVIEADDPLVGAFAVNVTFDGGVVDAVWCTADYGACSADFATDTARINGADAVGIGSPHVGGIIFHAVGTLGQCTALAIHLDVLTDTEGMDIPGVTTDGEICIGGPPTGAVGRVGIDHNGGAPNINAGPAINVVAGSTVDVPLVLQATGVGACCWVINVHHDEGILEAEGCAVPDPPYFTACNVFLPSAVRVVGVIGTTNPALTSPTIVLTTTYRALGSPGQCGSLHPEMTELFDNTAELSPMSWTSTNGTVCTVRCADINDDGHVDLRDALRLLLRILLRRGYDAAFDLNGDGLVNARDMTVLARQLGTGC